MTRTEVKNLSQTALITTTTAEHFSALEPTEENQRIGCRDIKPLAIHFFTQNLKVWSQPGRNWVAWFDHPDAFAFVCVSPDEIAAWIRCPPFFPGN